MPNDFLKGIIYGVSMFGNSNARLAGAKAAENEREQRKKREKDIEAAAEARQQHAAALARDRHDQQVAKLRTATVVQPVVRHSLANRSTARGPFNPVWWSEISILGDLGRIGDALFHARLPFRLISALVTAIVFWIASSTWPWAVTHVQMALGWVLGLGALAGLLVPSIIGWFIILIQKVVAFVIAAVLWLAVIGALGAAVFYGLKLLGSH
ncbi:MAG: hypothetical protein WAL34_04175 [Acidobacteriaceae bacterium]